VQIQFTDGHCYLGGYLASEERRDEYILEQVIEWTNAVQKILAASVCYPQTVYAGFCRSLQHEWQHLQRVVPDIGNHFEPIEEAIQNHLLPKLLSEPLAIFNELCPLLALSTHAAGLGIPYPTKLAT